MEVLQKCPLFSGFEKEEISILLQRAKGRQCKMKKGEKVPAGYLGLLLSGRLCIKGQAADSREIQLNHVLPGAAFCAAAPFLEGPALSDIYAEIASEVLLLSAEQLWAMMDDSPLFRKNYTGFFAAGSRFPNRRKGTSPAARGGGGVWPFYSRSSRAAFCRYAISARWPVRWAFPGLRSIGRWTRWSLPARLRARATAF